MSTPSAPAPAPRPPLMRHGADRPVSGVAAGLARHLGVPVGRVRVALALLTLIVLLTVVRPLVRQVLAPVPEAPALTASGLAIPGDAAVVAGPGGTVTVIDRDSPTARLMEFAKINGQIQAETVQRVVDMVRQSPGETAEVLRNWIHET